MVASLNKAARQPRGFTLLELLVVLAIAGMLVALVPPVISAVVPGARAKAAALELATTLRDARNVAITRSRSVDIRFDFEDATYAVSGEGTRDFPSGLPFALIDERGDRAAIRGTLDAEGRDSFTLRFYPDGSSNGLRALLGSPGKGYVVSVDWLMGRVLVTEAADDAV